MEPFNIDIIGTIGEDSTIKTLKANLKEADGKDLVLNIDSLGGSVFDGIAQYNALQEYPGKITAKINGVAASAASYLPLAADKVIAHENSTFMIHNVWSFVWGDHLAMRKEANENEALSNILAKLYSNKTGKKKNEIIELMDEETWFYGNEIQDFGIADEMINLGTNSDKAACISDCKAKFSIMKNNLDKDKYNEETRRVLNIVKTPERESHKKNIGDSMDNLKDAMDLLLTAKNNEKIDLETIAKHLDLSHQLITVEHKNAVATVKKLNGLTDGVELVEFVESLIDEKKLNSAAVREAKMTEVFGSKVDETTKKENVIRTFADGMLEGKEVTDKAIEDLKKNSIYLGLTADKADMNSDQNSLGVIEDNKTGASAIGGKVEV